MWSEIKKLYACREVIWHLAVTDLKAAHRHKLLGNLWALLDPLLMMLVLYFVFHILRERSYDYALYIFSGLIIWNFFTHNLTNAANCIRRQKVLVHKVPLPMGIFPISNMLRHLNDLGWGLLAFIIMKLFAQAPLHSYLELLLFPALLVLFCLFVLGISFLVAFLGVFLLDMGNILGVLLRLGFFLNPVFWPVSWMTSKLPQEYLQAYFVLNPFAGYLMVFRQILLTGDPTLLYEPPVPHYLLLLAAISVLSFLFGYWVFYLGRGRYTKYI